MSVLEVLQSYPTQWKALLIAINTIDPLNSQLLTFDTIQVTQILHHQIVFLIQVTSKGTHICRYVIDEEAYTSIMS
jgi:hypothetical protein